MVLFRPFRTFEIVRVEGEGSERLLRWTLVAAAILGALAGIEPLQSAAALLGAPARGEFWVAAGLLLSAMLMYGSLQALTGIERFGVQFFGRRRSWRVTPAIATTICAHAAAGWIVACVLASAATFAKVPLLDRLDNMTLTGTTAALIGVVNALPLIGFFAGMLLFESLVYLGIRRCRFGNRAR